MRIDKFLKVSRILKRRTVAKEACEGGKVSVNGRECKPSKEIAVGDVVEIGFANGSIKFMVKEISTSTKKADAEKMYEIVQ
ncbi:MAG: RNA-binding S4 domain-containing protein [Clostridia bacterium]|nr:RNA-binding S4 domain-containing protein [Clostridia bacterium]